MGGGAQRCTEVCGRVRKGAQRCAEVHRGARRCMEGCARWCTSCEGPGRQKSGSVRVCMGARYVGRILVHCKTCLQVPDSRVQAWSQQSCLRRDKIQYFGKVLQNSPLTSHKMRLNRAILTMTLPCQ